MIRDISRMIVLCGVFVLPLLPLIVTNSLFFPFITGKNFMFRIVVELIFGAWIVLVLYDSHYRPKFSWILGAATWLLAIMAIADAFGMSPHKSFWSNYERMEGYVTLAHLGIYFIVAASVLTTEKLWNAFWNTSILVAVGMMFYGFCQLSGSASCPISQSDFRIDGRMGNAAYLAIYMFFHVFAALLLLVRTKVREMRIFYALLMLGFAYILIKTGTRGTTLALGGGLFITGAYIAVFARENVLLRKLAVGMVVGVIVIAGTFFGARHSSFVQSSPILRRLTQITLADASTRFTIWKLAEQGVKEKPILGWGQENFNYVFNKQYKAALYAQEPWFDRVHDLVFDWLIAGGILGFLAYLGLLISALYYIVVRPFINPKADSFSVIERGVLLGLLVGYVGHNLLVFDNLVSYFLFFSVLAMVHARFAQEIPSVQEVRVEEPILNNIALPTLVVLTCALVYFVNIPSLQASSDLIEGFQATTPEARLDAFKLALSRNGFGNQEIREQLVRMTQSLVQDQTLAQQLAQANPQMTQAEIHARISKIQGDFINLSESELNKQVAETPDDARVLVFQSSFYRVIQKPDKAIEILNKAVELSPEKQQILFELALANMQKGDVAKGKEVFKHAFELEPANIQARLFYAAVAIQTGDDALAKDLLNKPEYENDIVNNDSILQAYYQRKKYPEVLNMLSKRIVNSPNDLQLHVSYAAVQNESGDVAGAIKTVEDAMVQFPDFKSQGEQFLAQLHAGKTPAPTKK